MALFMEISKTEIKNVAHKPCPFCGNTHLIVTDKDSFDELCKENGKSLVDIECNVCNTRMYMYSVPNNNYWLGVGMLIAKWNTRNGGNKNAD